VGTRGAWAAARGLGTPLAPIRCYGLASVLATPLRPRGAWVLPLCWARHCAHVALELLA